VQGLRTLSFSLFVLFLSLFLCAYVCVCFFYNDSRTLLLPSYWCYFVIHTHVCVCWCGRERVGVLLLISPLCVCVCASVSLHRQLSAYTLQFLACHLWPNIRRLFVLRPPSVVLFASLSVPHAIPFRARSTCSIATLCRAHVFARLALPGEESRTGLLFVLALELETKRKAKGKRRKKRKATSGINPPPKPLFLAQKRRNLRILLEILLTKIKVSQSYFLCV